MNKIVLVLILVSTIISCNSLNEPKTNDLHFFDAIGNVKRIALENQTVFGGNEETILYRYKNPKFNIDWSSMWLEFNEKGHLISAKPSKSSFAYPSSNNRIERFEDSIMIQIKSKSQIFNMKIKQNDSLLNYSRSDSINGNLLSMYKADYLIEKSFHIPIEMNYKELNINKVNFKRIKGSSGKDSVIIYRTPDKKLKGKIFYISYDSIGNWRERVVLYFLPDKRKRTRVERRYIEYFQN
ncbi:hypothetical protein [uncultured Dokdonia sp.]|uniref:hypothetical protein n=1 Tax=uncultured Dokdonia sp. TaxID=575653 RepID=UPI002629D675|nr:hypothetical protein [uncultured Dokdonia sp.]